MAAPNDCPSDHDQVAVRSAESHDPVAVICVTCSHAAMLARERETVDQAAQ